MATSSRFLPRWGATMSTLPARLALSHSAVSTALVGARTPAEVDQNDAGADIDLTPAERASIDAILAGAAGQVREYTPLRPAMEVWGDELPAAAVSGRRAKGA